MVLAKKLCAIEDNTGAGTYPRQFNNFGKQSLWLFTDKFSYFSQKLMKHWKALRYITLFDTYKAKNKITNIETD